MSGYASGFGRCFACGRPFFFNPLRVPSYQGEPICSPCITVVNERRKVSGLPLWPVFPGAYEPMPEEDLPRGE